MWFLGMYNNAGQISNCSPINLIGSEKEFLKWANQFKHFRVKKVKMTWVPMVKGPIQRVDPGKWGVYTGEPIAEQSYVNISNEASFRHSYQTDYEAYIIDPVVMPAYGSLDPAIGGKQWYLTDRDFDDIAVTNEMLPYIKRPAAKRHLMDHTWSHTWVPKVPRVFNFAYTNANTNLLDGTNNLLSITDGTLKKFPWVPICINQRFNNQDVSESVALRMDCTMPYIAIRDRRTYQWTGVDNNVVRTILGIPGKWHFHVTFQFKTRRSSQAAIFTDIASDGTLTKSNIAKVTAPQNPANNA
jgi:hypothetical protein